MTSAEDRASLGLFFTNNENDYRANSFVQACLNPPYTEPKNKDQTAPAESILSLAKSENYTVDKHNPNDMHHQFVDFIIETALWHRKIDEPVGEHPTIVQINDVVEAISQMVGYQYSSFDAQVTPKNIGSSGEQLKTFLQPVGVFTMTNFYALSMPVFHPPLATEDVRYSGLPGKRSGGDVFKYMYLIGRTSIPVLEAYLAQLFEKVMRSPSTDINGFIALNNNYLNTITEFITQILFEGKNTNWVDGKVDGAGNKLIGTQDLFEYPSNYNSPNKMLGKKLQDASVSDVNALVQNTRNNIIAAIRQYLVDFCGGLINDRKELSKDTKFPAAANYTSDVNNQWKTEHLLPYVRDGLIGFVTSLTELVQVAVASTLKDKLSLNHSDLSNDDVYNFYKNISKTQGTVRELYMNNLRLLKKNDNKEWKGVPITEHVSESDRKMYRLNFVKNPYGTAHTNFEYILPLVWSKYRFHQLWYSMPNGKEQRISISSGSNCEKILQDLYYKVYVSKSINPLTIRLTHDPTQSVTINGIWTPSTNQKFFEVDKNKIIQELFTSGTKAYRAATRGAIDLEMIDVYSGLYKLDSTGNIVLYKDGRKIDINPKAIESNCMGTFVYPSNDSAGCMDYITKCIKQTVNMSDGDRKTACINMLVNGTHGFVIPVDKLASSIYPKTVVDTLLALQFQGVPVTKSINGSPVSYLMCESVNEWLSRLNSDVADKVRGNNDLLRYLNTFVNFVNRNPGLLPKNRNVSFSNSTDLSSLEYTKKYNITPYRRPNLIDQFHGLQSYLRRHYPARSVQTFRTMFGSGKVTSSRVRVPNINAVVPHNSSAFAPQSGGHFRSTKYNSASEKGHTGWGLLNRLYEQIQRELASKNKTIGNDSKNKINNLLTSYKEAEINLTDNLVQLEKYLWLTDVWNDVTKKSVELDQMSSLYSEHDQLVQRLQKSQDKIYNVMFGLIKVVNTNDPVMSAYESSFKGRQIPDKSLVPRPKESLV